MITVTRLEQAEMDTVIDSVMSKQKRLHGPTLVAMCLRELKTTPDNYYRWEKQLQKRITYRIFRCGDFSLRKDS